MDHKLKIDIQHAYTQEFLNTFFELQSEWSNFYTLMRKSDEKSRNQNILSVSKMIRLYDNFYLKLYVICLGQSLPVPSNYRWGEDLLVSSHSFIL